MTLDNNELLIVVNIDMVSHILTFLLCSVYDMITEGNIAVRYVAALQKCETVGVLRYSCMNGWVG